MSDELASVESRARIHAALGDPARLRVVDRLLLTDASPGEVAHLLGLSTNLVAHHLGVLESAGLVVRSRSEGDRRRTYLRLVPEVLASLVVSLPLPASRVVFVCSHNSARSQLAAALLARRSSVPAASAGTRPAARVHPQAIKVARRHGLRLGHLRPVHIDDVLRPDDLVVAVCDRAHEQLDEGPRLHWSVPDPATAHTDAAFERAFDDLSHRIDRLLPVLKEIPR
jgi:protein-tyrosine-phosphatase